MKRFVWIFFVASIGLGVPVCARAHGDLHERIVAVTAQLETNAASPELWLVRADLQRQHGDFIAALSDLSRATALKTNWPAAILQRARIAADMEIFPECIRSATACLGLDPANADAHVLRARALAKQKDFAAAAADYDAVLDATNAATPLPDLYLERARARAELKEFAVALAGLDAGMARFGSTPSLALPAINYERERGNIAAALERLATARPFFNAESYAALQRGIKSQTKLP